MRPFLMIRPFPLFIVACLAASTCALCAAPVWAGLAPGKFGFSAPKAATTPGGYRLDGNATEQAIIRLPQLEVTAGAIAFDGRTVQDFSEVRALGNVNLKITLQPQKSGGETVYIESNSDKATLTRADRKLVLEGNLSGFYRIGGDPPTKLSGSKATFDYGGDLLNALIESGDNAQVKVELPAETGKTDALGPVTLLADSLRLDQKNGALYFIGNARAFSTGENKLDVKAPSFTLQRAADGTIGTLTTNGKTFTKLDLPSDPNPSATPSGTPSATPSGTGVGKPTHLEVTSDKAIVNRANSSGVFDGNVVGFYRLQGGATPDEKYDFNGDRATVTYDAQAAKTGNGLSIVMTGGPVNVEVPAINFKF